MRNRAGVEIKPGYYAWIETNTGNRYEGVIRSLDRSSFNAKHYGPRVVLDSGHNFSAEAVVQVLPPMRRTKGGVVKANPLTRVRIKSPSMATGDEPSPRLVKRRKKTARAPAGFYANPLKPSSERYHVLAKKPRSKSWESVARFKLWDFAVAYGRALHDAHPTWALKIEERAK